ncbi:MAG TPA: PDZ domain-containing protein [Verrucomicrobiae bacterium]|jgi:serine protease Do|nr:PDZ domain-containing protein [Verrucomicrobiae bacterium]
MFRSLQSQVYKCLGLVAAGSITFSPFAYAAPSAFDAEHASPLRAEIDAAIAHVRPALVRIRVVSDEFHDGREVKMQEVGSGAIISKDGYIITNHHVAGHAVRMFCTLWNREEIEAELIGTDPLTDISIIKLKPETPREFKSVTFGDSSAMHVGDNVLAMGSPMALSQSVTLGILSNTEMVMPRFFGPGSQFRLDGEDVGSLVRWFAHDAAIYGGNSGGPLVNLRGDIIGINEISFGLSGAIPGNLAKSIALELIDKHKIARSWLGIDAQPTFKTTKNEHGILIGGVAEGSPAEWAGLHAGDILLSINKTPTDARFEEQMPDFMWLVSTLPIGKEVTAVVHRGNADVTLKMVPVERGQIYLKQTEVKQWGLDARDYSFLLAKEMKRTNLDGVLVTSVRPGGPAGESKPSIEPGDTIVEMNQVPVRSVADLVAQSHKLTQGKTDPVPVVTVFERKAERYMTVVRVGIEDFKDPGLEVSKAWLPIETHVISREIAKLLGEPTLKGFYLTRVYPDSTAERAGMLAGDFITAVDGEKLSASGPEDEDELSTLIRQYDIGKKVELSVIRNNKPIKVTVELVRSPRLEREMKKYRNDDFEFTARDVCFFDAADEEWDTSQKGAIVEDVKPGSWAELASLYNGDLILEVDGEAVNNVDMLRSKMERIAAAKKSTVVMKVLRGIHTSYLELEPNWKN